MKIDEKDKRILEELAKDARLPTKRIAANLDIPRVTVHTRIEKMKLEGVIKKFTILTDFKKIGLPVTAFVFVSYNPQDNITQQSVAEKISQMENVFEVHLISGEWDMLVKIRGESLDQIGKIVLDDIRTLKGVAKTITCPSFSSIKNGV
ncbi:MAG: Lrp/AsnC family transcriptional regulator [Candidatus Heimdallarchaeota archaeon]|nr:MAG: Lrp/AsnC family transcriptional regulator [Candidatus Heimdallarchaeota archaeon]